MASTNNRNNHHRPVEVGGAFGRGATSPLGGRSNPDRSFRSDGRGRISVQPLEKARGEQPGYAKPQTEYPPAGKRY